MSLSDNYTVDVTQGNGSTDTFTGNWSPINSSFMRVYLELISTGAQTLQVLNTDYTLTFSSSGYQVVFTTPPSALYNVIRSREIAKTQENPFRTSTGFQGLVHENAFDKLTAIDQELEEGLSRKIGFALGSSSTATLPEPVASNLLGWNSAGDDLENKVAADIDLAAVSAFIGTLLDDSDAATARATLGAAASSDYLQLAGGTMTGKLNTVASASGGAGLNLPHGAAPSAPVDGDLWSTTAGMFARINGATQQLGAVETGTYTVTLTATSSGTITLNASNDTGHYVKIPLIGGLYLYMAGGRVRTSGISSPTGTLRILLPFTISDLTDDAGWGSASVMLEDGASNSGNKIAIVAGGSPYIAVYNLSGQSFTGAAGDIDADCYVHFRVWGIGA